MNNPVHSIDLVKNDKRKNDVPYKKKNGDAFQKKLDGYYLREKVKWHIHIMLLQSIQQQCGQPEQVVVPQENQNLVFLLLFVQIHRRN